MLYLYHQVSHTVKGAGYNEGCDGQTLCNDGPNLKCQDGTCVCEDSFYYNSLSTNCVESKRKYLRLLFFLRREILFIWDMYMCWISYKYLACLLYISIFLSDGVKKNNMPILIWYEHFLISWFWKTTNMALCDIMIVILNFFYIVPALLMVFVVFVACNQIRSLLIAVLVELLTIIRTQLSLTKYLLDHHSHLLFNDTVLSHKLR